MRKLSEAYENDKKLAYAVCPKCKELFVHDIPGLSANLACPNTGCWEPLICRATAVEARSELGIVPEGFPGT